MTMDATTFRKTVRTLPLLSDCPELKARVYLGDPYLMLYVYERGNKWLLCEATGDQPIPRAFKVDVGRAVVEARAVARVIDHMPGLDAASPDGFYLILRFWRNVRITFPDGQSYLNAVP